MPNWLQQIASFSSSYLSLPGNAIHSAGRRHATSKANLISALCLVMAMAVALFVGIKLFRWEKEEKISGKAKLWVLVVLAPFFIIGVYQAKTKQSIEREKQMDRAASQMRTVLFNNVNIFVGNGETIQGGSVLIKTAKSRKSSAKPPQDTKALNADVVEEAGKTLMPGLIDMHVHIGAPGGVFSNPQRYADPSLESRRLAAICIAASPRFAAPATCSKAQLHSRQNDGFRKIRRRGILYLRASVHC